MQSFIKLSALLSFAAYGAAVLTGGGKGKASACCTWLGALFNLAALVARSLYLGRLPLTNGADFLLLFALLTALFYLAITRAAGIGGGGFLVMLLPALLCGISRFGLMADLVSAAPLAPALRSPLLFTHVFTAALSYAGFALSAGLAGLRLWGKLPQKLHAWIPRIVVGSFFMLSLTIVLGAFWAEVAWGSYWSWDPKEIWALVTWLIYAVYLHRQGVWSQRKCDIMLLVGIALVLFTFFGTNYLLTGLHSYA